MPHCSLAAKVFPTIGCLCALPCLYFGIPLLLWPVGEWITWGEISFDLKCGNQWVVDVYYNPEETELTCLEVVEQVSVEFEGTPPKNRNSSLEIFKASACTDSSLQTEVVTDGSDADNARKHEDLKDLGSLTFYTEGAGGEITCFGGGVYKVNSPGAKLWVKEIGLVSAWNTFVQSTGITVFFGGAFACIGAWGCLGICVCLLSEEPQTAESQMQMQQMQMQQMQQMQQLQQMTSQMQMQQVPP